MGREIDAGPTRTAQNLKSTYCTYQYGALNRSSASPNSSKWICGEVKTLQKHILHICVHIKIDTAYMNTKIVLWERVKAKRLFLSAFLFIPRATTQEHEENVRFLMYLSKEGDSILASNKYLDSILPPNIYCTSRYVAPDVQKWPNGCVSAILCLSHFLFAHEPPSFYQITFCSPQSIIKQTATLRFSYFFAALGRIANYFWILLRASLSVKRISMSAKYTLFVSQKNRYCINMTWLCKFLRSPTLFCAELVGLAVPISDPTRKRKPNLSLTAAQSRQIYFKIYFERTDNSSRSHGLRGTHILCIYTRTIASTSACTASAIRCICNCEVHNTDLPPTAVPSYLHKRLATRESSSAFPAIKSSSLT